MYLTSLLVCFEQAKDLNAIYQGLVCLLICFEQFRICNASFFKFQVNVMVASYYEIGVFAIQNIYQEVFICMEVNGISKTKVNSTPLHIFLAEEELI